MRVLVIESSCDETGVAIYDEQRGLMAERLYSQISLHKEYGGVVPELASRDHVLKLLPLDKLEPGYFFESDMLYRLSTIRARVVDIPLTAIYADEESHLNDLKIIPVFATRHLRNFLSRIFYCYFLRDFHLASLQWLLGPALMLFGGTFGLFKWQQSISLGIEASAGTVMLAGLPLIIGLQLLLSAIGFDIDNQPTTALHPQLRE